MSVLYNVQKLKRAKLFDLSSVVRPITVEQCGTMAVDAFRRVLDAESKYEYMLAIS